MRNVTIRNKGVYACAAQNIAGNSESTTEVSIMGKMNHTLFFVYSYVF